MTIRFTVPGNPFGWQRAGQNHNTGAIYTQKNTEITENAIAWEYRRKYRSQMFPPKTALNLFVIAYMPIPKSAPWKIRAQMITGAIRPIVKPDWDNIGKLVSDALNKVAYDDDKCIVDSRVVKVYSENPRTEIIIKEAKLFIAPPGDTGEI